jgi:hypothetical protein
MNAPPLPVTGSMQLTAVLWLTLAVAMLAFAVLSWLDLTRDPTQSTPPATVAPGIDPERCPSTNGQLRSCEDDEVVLTLRQ